VTAWGEFLQVRSKMIDEFHKDGKTDEEISRILSTDPVQIMMIRTRDRRLDRWMEAKPTKKSKRKKARK
jgi:hypothetical protein